MKFRTASFVLLPMLLLAACGSNGDHDAGGTATSVTTAADPSGKAAVPISVVSVDLGTAIDDDSRITAPATTFSPGATVYASVNTAGSASDATLMAHWTYREGNALDEQTRTISPSGPVSTAFRLSRADGLPRGSYQVQISLDGQPVAQRDFSVD